MAAEIGNDGDVNTELLSSNLEAFMKRVDSGQREELAAIINNTGMKGLLEHIYKTLDLQCAKKIRLGVIGETGAGKSSLVNTLRGLGPQEEGAVKVGTVETTHEIRVFTHPKLPNYELHDVPGVNGLLIEKEKYVDAINLSSFNVAIICTATRFTENDKWLGEQCEERKIPFVLLRTKIDQDVMNKREDYGVTEGEAIREIRNHLLINVRQFSQKWAVFLISTKMRDNHRYDYPLLVQYIADILPVELRAKFIFSFETFSMEILKMKRQQLENRIARIALIHRNDVAGDELCLFRLHSDLTDDDFCHIFAMIERDGYWEEKKTSFSLSQKHITGIRKTTRSFISYMSKRSCIVGELFKDLLDGNYEAIHETFTVVLDICLKKAEENLEKRLREAEMNV